MQSLHQDDTVQAVHEWYGGVKPLHQQEVDGATSTQNLLECHCADKRRHYEGQSRQSLQPNFAAELVPRDDISER